jgi:hypothetical protein
LFGKTTETMPATWSLEEFMALRGAMLMTPSGTLEDFSKAQIVRATAEKLGGAHQDWMLDEREATLFAPNMLVSNQPVLTLALMGIATSVIEVGRRFLTEYESRIETDAGDGPHAR